MGPSRRRLGVAFASTALLTSMLLPAAVTAGTEQTYVVLYKAQAVPSNAVSKITLAGGTLVASYPAIGVAIARSSSDTFRAALEKDSKVAAAAATGANALHLQPDTLDDGANDALPQTPATDSDSLSGLQWDMVQIHTPEAHAITGGSPAIVVGDIDTGLDYTHPDLAANVDGANSVNCVSGAPVPGAVAAMDDNGHGTHTAGTIAAASNGIGIVGVAPNVKIAGIKAGDAAGFFFPQAVICAFMWAGSHHISVTNNSYFADPWLFNCKNDKEQKAIYSAEQRAIKYAIQQGTVVVAAMGNQADDLAHPTKDATSPDNTTPVVRDVTNACAVVPTEVPGVIGVSADGNTGLKSFYSSYGVGVTDVVAPGGDSILGRTAAAPNGRVLSTWPASLLTVTCLAARRVVDVSGATYCYQQGTSMAAPHVAGLAALVKGLHPGWSNGAVASQIGNTADPMACPDDVSIYGFFPAVDNGAPQVCTGGSGSNSFYGKGQVNALTAVQ